MTDNYQPKHLRQPLSHMSHCCFGGCTLMACGCCSNMPFHEAECEHNPSRMFEEAEHDIYVANDLRQHLKVEQ